MGYKYDIKEVREMSDWDLEHLIDKVEKYDNDLAGVDAICKWVALGVTVIIAIILACMFLLPQYGVWKAELDGKAKLAEAEYSKQVLVQEAQSNLEAEKLNAESEVERAKGAAEARKTEGLGMTAEQYIQYLWVKKLDLSQSKTIYLPTEGGLPKMNYTVNE